MSDDLPFKTIKIFVFQDIIEIFDNYTLTKFVGSGVHKNCKVFNLIDILDDLKESNNSFAVKFYSIL